jgi:4-amino-4-deoxy-L-arabinose transferase-like glycosyltransferase
LRLGFLWRFYSHPHQDNSLTVDGYQYLAQALVRWGEFGFEKGVPTIVTTPGYPLYIALVFLIVGEKPLALVILNALMSTAMCVLAYALGRRLFSERTGLLAAGFWAVYPYAIYYTAFNYRETFLGFLIAIELYGLLEWRRKPRTAAALFCGGLGAWIALTNPVSLILLAAAPLWLLIEGRLRSVLRQAVFYYLLLAVLYAPWPLRNYRAFGAPFLTNVHSGLNMLQGLLVPPEKFGTAAETEILDADPEYKQGMAFMGAEDYVAAYRVFGSASRRRIRENPGGYLKAVCFRVLKLWRLVPYDRQYSYNYRTIFWISLLSDGIIIPLGLLGMAAYWKRWRELLPLYGAAALWTLAYALVFVVIRFRMPVMIVMVLFSAALIDRLIARESFSGRL